MKHSKLREPLWEWAKAPPTLALTGVIANYGYQIQQVLENRHELDAQVTEKLKQQLTVYDGVKSDLNDIYTYLTLVGRWKEFKSTAILEAKWDADSHMHVEAPLMTPRTFEDYKTFMTLAFETCRAFGKDAAIRANSGSYASTAGYLSENPPAQFSGEAANFNKLTEAYYRLILDFGDSRQIESDLSQPSKPKRPTEELTAMYGPSCR